MGNYLAGFGENSGLLVKTVLHPVKNNYCLTLSIFLSIELQSYGLYLLSTIYRNSELATTGGLIYFLLGATGCGNSLPLRQKLPNSGDILRLMILSNI